MGPDASDENLVVLAQAGDRDAFMTLYNRYLKKVYNRVKSRVPATDADDVTQEVFIALVKSLPRFEQRSSFSTWLYTIVNRQIADFYRRHYRQQDHKNISLDAYDELNLPAADGENDEMLRIQQALHTLPENYQEVILMRFADGLSFSDIASKTGKSLEATKSLYRRAIHAINEKLGKD